MQPARATSDALRHTRMVRLLRVILPLLMLWLAGAVAFPPGSGELVEDLILKPTGDRNRIERGRWLGLDQMLRPYRISWEAAWQSELRSDLVQLTNPAMSLFQENGSWVTASAGQGTYDPRAGILSLKREVQVLRDDGLELNTPHAEVDLRAKTVRGAQGVVGQGPSGVIEAGGFLIEDSGRRIVLFDRVRASGS